MKLFSDYKPAKGSVAFPYKGYELSVSNMFGYPEGAAFVKGRSGAPLFVFDGSAEGLKKAMQKVDRMVRKAEKEEG